jgi:Raf kinase inhibitor-like YbhB/YbcL family protein
MPPITLTPRISQRTTEVRVGLMVTSQAFKSGEPIPSKYACDGEDVSPPVGWSGSPEKTRSYAVIVDDVDAPMGLFTHWVIFNIPGAESSLQEGVPTVGTLPNGATQGRNDFGKIGYAGPCPPSGTHRYVFHLYALDALLSLQAGATRHDVLEAMKGHILAEAELTALYSRG